MYLDRASRHHVKDDSQSKKGKSRGKGASPRHIGTTKDQEDAPASVKRKNPPSVSRTVEKKRKKRPAWTLVVPKTTTPTLRKPLQARNNGLKKEKKSPGKVWGELIMMLAKLLRIMTREHRAGTFVYLEKCRAIDVTTSFITAQRS